MHLDPCRCCATGLWCSGWSHPSSCCGTSRWLCGSNRETETLVTFTWFLSHTDDQATTCGKLTDLEPLRRVSGLCWAAVWFSSQSSCFCGAPRLCRTDLPPAVCCNQRFRSEMSESEWRALVSCAHVNFQGESGNFSALSRLHTQRGRKSFSSVLHTFHMWCWILKIVAFIVWIMSYNPEIPEVLWVTAMNYGKCV